MLSSIKLLRKIILEYTFRRPPMQFLKSTFRDTPLTYKHVRGFFATKRDGLWINFSQGIEFGVKGMNCLIGGVDPFKKGII
jgi:hypothetical protein